MSVLHHNGLNDILADEMAASHSIHLTQANHILQGLDEML